MDWKELDLPYHQLADEIVTACYTKHLLVLASSCGFVERCSLEP